MDESSKQLLKEVREPQRCEPHCPAKQDYEYERNGTRNLFIFCEPQTGQCHIEVTQQRTMPDFAHFMLQLDKRYCEAEVIRVVLDNLNAHAAKSFYETFEPQERGVWPDDSSFITRPSMAVGSIWPRLNWRR